MKQSSFNNLPREEQDWLDDYLDGTISPESFQILQDRMVESSALRSIMRRYLTIDNALQNESDGAPEISSSPWLGSAPEPQAGPASQTERAIRFRTFVPSALAAGLAFFLGLAFMNWKSGPVRADQMVTARCSRRPPVRGKGTAT